MHGNEKQSDAMAEAENQMAPLQQQQPPTRLVPSLQSFFSSAETDLVSSFDISSFEGEKEGSGPEFIWRNQYQHAMYFLTYSYSWGLFCSHRRGSGIEEINESPSWIHILIVYIIFAGPLLYLETFIGQYTHKGCIIIGEMVPFAYGVGYSILLHTFLACSLNLYFCSIIMYYLLVSMLNYPTPSWMLCLPDYQTTDRRCFSRDDIDLCVDCTKNRATKPCFNPDTDVLSATLFKDNIIFASSQIENNNIDVTPDFTRSVHLILTTSIVVILAVRSLRDIDDAIRISVIFSIVSIVVTIAVIFLNHYRLNLFESIFRFSLPSLINVNCWKRAFITATLRFGLMEGGHFLFGSYMPLSVNSIYRVFYLVLSHIFFLGLSTIFVFMMDDYFICNLNISHTLLFHFSDVDSTFVIYPTVLGIFAAAQLWTTLYFGILFSLTLHGISLQIIVIQETVSQVLINRAYYVYTRLLLVLLAVIFGLILTSPTGAELATEIYLNRGIIIFLLGSMIFSILLIYGLDRFSDDMEFILHSSPPTYLKFSWFLSLVICIIMFLFTLFDLSSLKYQRTTIAIVIIIFIPIPIGFVYQLIRAIRKKGLTTLVKGDKFEPEDDEDKANRRLFNPRYEVRFRRRHNHCKHRCLLGSVALKRCLERELVQLSRVLLEIEENEEERVVRKKLLQALRIHKVIMTQALNFNPDLEYFLNHENDYVNNL